MFPSSLKESEFNTAADFICNDPITKYYIYITLNEYTKQFNQRLQKTGLKWWKKNYFSKSYLTEILITAVIFKGKETR